MLSRPLLVPLLLASLSLIGACAHGPTPPAAQVVARQPEAASGWQAKPGWRFERQAVAAAHPLAAEAGAQMLRAGGAAIDAAVAAQLVLGLVEPQSSGLGGGALLMLWDERTGSLHAYDGRESAPAAAREDLFLGPDGRPMPFEQAAVGGRAVGVPGLLRMLALAHQRHGRLPWARLFEPAIRIAEQGFPLGARLHALLLRETALARDPQAGPLFYAADGRPLPLGTPLRNPAQAALLRRIAAEGPDAFYRGAAAADMVRRVRGHAGNPGLLSLDDLAGYRALERAPLCGPWRGLRVCGFPPPSSGQLALLQMLALLEAQGEPAPATDPLSPDWLHRYSEAARLAYADRARHVADPDFVAVPLAGLLDPGYLRQRAALIGPTSLGLAPAGRPPGMAQAWAPQAEQPEYGTSHLSVADAHGQVLALTSSIEAAFGARLMSDGGTGLPGGFLLNNQLTDFALAPRDGEGRPVANRLEPGKRPRSSMSPTLVFDDAAGSGPQLSLGSPGGPAIIHFAAKALIGVQAWGLSPQQAIELPNHGSYNGPATLLEAGRFPATTLQALRRRGHRVVEAELPSGLQLLQRGADGAWLGGADPRREGAVAGD